MINANMRHYDYFTLGSKNSYGNPILTKHNGKIKMCINTSSQNVQDNILFKDCSYVGLTNSYIDDSFVIQYGSERLKVLYVNKIGRYKQVYMKVML